MVNADEMRAAFLRLREQAAVRGRFRSATDNSGAYWNALRAAWALQLPAMADGRRVSPYFLDWRFTPIERNAWHEIRCAGLPLYPQCPVGGVFVDFADPHRRVGLELDGAQFHDRDRDEVRDSRLWTDFGWRIFRVTGAESYRVAHDFDDPRAARADWTWRTIDGVVWSLGIVYYGHPHTQEEFCTALAALERHHLADFPLHLDDGGID